MNEEIIFNRESICWFNFTTLLLLKMKLSRAMTASSLKIMETSLWIILFGVLLMFGNYSASKFIYCAGAARKWRNIFIRFLHQCIDEWMGDEWSWKILMRVCELFPRIVGLVDFTENLISSASETDCFSKNRQKVSSFLLDVVGNVSLECVVIKDFQFCISMEKIWRESVVKWSETRVCARKTRIYLFIWNVHGNLRSRELLIWNSFGECLCFETSISMLKVSVTTRKTLHNSCWTSWVSLETWEHVHFEASQKVCQLEYVVFDVWDFISAYWRVSVFPLKLFWTGELMTGVEEIRLFIRRFLRLSHQTFKALTEDWEILNRFSSKNPYSQTYIFQSFLVYNKF